MKKRVVSWLLCLTMTAGLLMGCGSDGSGKESSTGNPSNQGSSESGEATGSSSSENNEVPAGDPTVIRWGHNWSREMNPHFNNEDGTPSIGNVAEREARLYAEQQILEKYNCVIEFVDYPSSSTEDILRSVLAGDPIADIVRMCGDERGQILAQNVLQPLDDYAGLFADEDEAWMFWGPVYGHNYFLSEDMHFGTWEPLCYNIEFLGEIEALKVDGKTKYPADYFVEGNWTWSVFEDYLQKVQDYIKANPNSGPDHYRCHPYDTDYRVAATQAIYSNGGEVYGNSGLGIDSNEAKEAVAYIDRLKEKGLLSHINADHNDDPSDDANVNGGEVWYFQWNWTAFTNLPQWLAGDMEGRVTMGIVPFPRPDGMAFDDPNYRQLNDAANSYGIPKGISPERTELILKVYKEYTQSYYKKLAGRDEPAEKAMDFFRSEYSAKNQGTSRLRLDITNEEYGDNILKALLYLVEGDNALVNDYSQVAGIYSYWSKNILGYSLYGVNGAASYDVQVEASKGVINDLMANYESTLSGAEFKDNITPKLTKTEGDTVVFPAGTDPNGVDWKSYMTAEDNIDGTMDMSKAKVDFNEIDFNEVGEYGGKLVYSITDEAGNTGSSSMNVIIYNGDNTTAPTLVIKEEYGNIEVDKNVSDINWKDDYVEEAKDADGLDLKNMIKADLSELDTTTPGEYNVELTVTDYAGNETKQTIKVTVGSN